MRINTGQYEFDLITAVLSTKDLIKRSTVIDKLTVDMFGNQNTQRAWDAIKQLHDEQQIVDVVGVSSRMGSDNDLLWLADIMGGSSAQPSNIIGYAKRVRQSSYLMEARRRSVEALKVIDELSDITQVETVAGSIESLFDGLLLETSDKKPQSFKEVAKEYVVKIQEKAQGMDENHVVLTGITDLDQNTGGFNKTDLVLVGGTPGSGKTEFSIKILRGVVKSGLGALMFSLEMSNHQVVERAISGESQLPVSNLRNPLLLNNNNGWKMMENGLGALVDKNFYMTDQAGLTVESIMATAKRHKQDHPDLSCIVVDYAGLLQLPKESRHDIALGTVSRKLKQLAKDIETPVVLLTQLNSKNINARPVNDREPVASDIKDSSRLEDDADLILLCHRQFTHDENSHNIAQIILAKARHAIKGVNVYFRFIDGHFVPTSQDMASNEIEQYKNKSKPVEYKKSSKLN